MFKSMSVFNRWRSLSTTSVWNESSLPDRIRNLNDYHALYSLSVKDPNRFWKMAAQRLDWYKFPTIIKNTEFDYRTKRGVDIKWYEDGVCLDRHIAHDHSMTEQTAIIFEADSPSDTRHHVSYGQLLHDVKKFANVLKKHGVNKGDRVTIYMPMVVEATIALLACARIGAVHSVVFAGFSANNLAERIADCDSTVVITTDIGVRGGKSTPLKSRIDQALTMTKCQSVKKVLVFERNHGMKQSNDSTVDTTDETSSWIDGRDYWVHNEMQHVTDICPPEPMNAEDPLFIVR
jgi:acetyl-CoA synthetase